MQLEISPEPTQPERAAIEAALERVLAEGEQRQNPWWEAGVRENLGADDEAGPELG